MQTLMNTYWARGILISLPVFTQIVLFVLYTVTREKELLYLVSCSVLLGLLIKFLKQTARLVSPKGASRPKGATDCKSFPCSGRASNTGMPSGHSASAGFFAMYAIARMGVEGIEDILAGCFVGFLGLMVMYSRIVYKCHTLAQVFAGGTIGVLLGFLSQKYYTEKIV